MHGWIFGPVAKFTHQLGDPVWRTKLEHGRAVACIEELNKHEIQLTEYDRQKGQRSNVEPKSDNGNGKHAQYAVGQPAACTDTGGEDTDEAGVGK
ncbi:uncharacterized protein C824.09c [Aspergillus lentulus]|uniref:uncharacterized protein C824.09c n=1 Tax=Aspergillus lentulus TaxID=293939 RepID=UPI001395AA4A|nr:uncharacterized protein C824.09c [Aspergillus lentulus]GFF27487.1 uncharacterized protein C824.09c [Aspergillus lentulus]